MSFIILNFFDIACLQFLPFPVSLLFYSYFFLYLVFSTYLSSPLPPLLFSFFFFFSPSALPLLSTSSFILLLFLACTPSSSLVLLLCPNASSLVVLLFHSYPCLSSSLVLDIFLSCPPTCTSISLLSFLFSLVSSRAPFPSGTPPPCPPPSPTSLSVPLWSSSSQSLCMAGDEPPMLRRRSNDPLTERPFLLAKQSEQQL